MLVSLVSLFGVRSALALRVLQNKFSYANVLVLGPDCTNQM